VKRERLNTAETLGWSILGFGLGMAGGLWAAGWVGRVSRRRLADEFRAVRAPAPSSSAALADAVADALAAEPSLASHDLRPVPVARGTVELTGWVPDRQSRTRAVRIASAVPGLVDLINSILVHGEDDLSSPPELTLEGRSA